MKLVFVLRVSSVWALLTSCLHTVLFLSYTPKHGPEELALVEAMKSHLFSFGGTPLSYWQMYYGYALLSTLTDFAEGALLWQLANLARSGAERVRPFVTLLLLFNIGHVLIVSQYFFRAPLINDVPVALLLAVVLVQTMSSRRLAPVRGDGNSTGSP